MNILRLHKSHIEKIVELSCEFDEYIQSLSSVQRSSFDREKKRKQILENAFWKKKVFSGYVAKIGKDIVGFVFYHYGFDPDEMEWKVIYMFELFVSEQGKQWLKNFRVIQIHLVSISEFGKRIYRLFDFIRNLALTGSKMFHLWN